MTTSKTTRVYEVLYTSTNTALRYESVAFDGSFVKRFKGKGAEAKAKAFASERRWNGEPCKVGAVDYVGDSVPTTGF